MERIIFSLAAVGTLAAVMALFTPASHQPEKDRDFVFTLYAA